MKQNYINAIRDNSAALTMSAILYKTSQLDIAHLDESAEAAALAISEYLQARQDQRDAEMERMVERGQDAAQEARGRSGKFHYDEEMPLEQAFEG